MENQKEKECYGAFRSRPECARCPYAESCRYYMVTEMEFSAKADPSTVSVELVQEWHPALADFRHVPGGGEEPEENLSVCNALAGFFRYLLDLDDYELGILCEVIAPRSGAQGPPTVSRLARKRGCSRQAMHKKLMKMIGRHPELAGMLQLILFKVSRGRQLFRRRRAAAQAAV